MTKRPQARVVIRPEHREGSVNRDLFGQNGEWYKFNYDHLWEGDRPSAALLDAIRELGVSSIRFPGGGPGDHYHWEQAVGPLAEREPQLQPFDNKLVEPRLGPDELLDLCREVGATPWLQTNPVSGTGEQAGAWAAHCRDRGMPVPHWELGNEIYLGDPDQRDHPVFGAASALSPEQYVERAGEQMRRIREATPEVAVGAIGGRMPRCGWYGSAYFRPGWNETVLQELGQEIDFLAIHTAYGPLIGASADPDDTPEWWNEVTPDKLRGAYLATAASPVAIRATLDDNLAMADEYAPGRELALAVTEWTPWFGVAHGAPDLGGTMGAALYIAGALNEFLREPRVIAAHLMTFVQEGFGSCITITADGFRRSVQHAVLSLYAAHLGDELVGVDVTSDTFDAPRMGVFPAASDVPTIGALATSSADGTATVILTNRDLDNPRRVEIDPGGRGPGEARLHVLTADHYLEGNGPFVGPYAIQRPLEDPVAVRDVGRIEGTAPWTVELPACSVSAVSWSSAS